MCDVPNFAKKCAQMMWYVQAAKSVQRMCDVLVAKKVYTDDVVCSSCKKCAQRMCDV